MDQQMWLREQLPSLAGKTVVITGATGGLGKAACMAVLEKGGELILVNRSREKSLRLRKELLEQNPQGDVELLYADLCDIKSVDEVCQALKSRPIDVLLLNAGAYHIPRATCSSGWDNVFQTNFVSHYYMVKELLPHLEACHSRVTAVGSIGHYLSRTDPGDVDFSKCTMPMKVYGNSKRYLMFALMELLKENPNVRFSIGHPGISPTNITSNYPKFISALIKWPMRLIYMKPEKAVRSILLAMLREVPYLHWVGPRVLNVWGSPTVKALKSVDEQERQEIFASAEELYAALKV